MVSCLFHDERTQSMKLYKDHFYCFGCCKYGDVIDMVGKLFGISPKEVAEKIANDFGISYENQSKNNVDGKRGIVNRIKKEHEKEKENHIFRVLCSYFKLLQDWKRELAPSSTDDEVNPLFVE